MENTEAQSVPAAGAERDDVHADVRAAVEALTNKQEPAAADAGDTAKADRDRNERGQFTQRAEGQQPDASQTSDTDQTGEKPTQPSKAVEPPTSWSADARAEFSKLPPAVQAAVAKREAEINEGGARWSEEKRRLEETISPLRARAQTLGVDEREGLNRLLAADEFLEKNPVQAIQWLAQAYGVDLQTMQQTQAKPQADPAVSQLYQKVSTLEQALQERERQEVDQTLATFASAPGHEHFEEVKVTMGRFIQSGQAKTLDEAYDMAVWATPGIREKLIAAQTANRADEDRKAREREAAAKAKRGALSVNGSPSLGSPPAAKQDFETVDDAARAAARAHGWAV